MVAEGDRVGLHGERDRPSAAQDDDTTGSQAVGPSPFVAPRGYHFRRQSPRSGYIVDFVCMKQKLIVEIDGGQHNFDAHAARDRSRDRRFFYATDFACCASGTTKSIAIWMAC